MALDLNNMPNYTARLPKTAHKMNQSLTYMTSTGMELPVYKDLLCPGDKLHFSATQFARINQIIKPALCKVDFHLDYFFVPLTVICNYASSWLWKTDDLINGNYLFGFSQEDFPLAKFDDFFSGLYSNSSGKKWEDINIYPFGDLTNGAILSAQGFDALGKGAYRLLDLLGYNPNGVFHQYALDNQLSIVGGEYSNPNVCPWFLCAYQAIHQLWFRNDDREKKSYFYNIDKFADQNIDSGGFDTLQNLVTLRYTQRNPDYFQSVKVSPLASPTSLLDVNSGDTSDLLAKCNSYLSGVDTRIKTSGNVTVDLGSTSTQVGANAYQSAVNTGGIRTMFAVEKMLRIIGRTEKTYEAQVLAHFGYHVPHDVLHNISHIGHDMGTLEPEVVISQSDTFDGSDGQSLGSVGGQGSIKFTGRKHHFEAPCHGIFMVVAHCVPRPRYYGGFDKQNVLNNPLDFYQPEYDKLGMQPLFAYEGDSVKIGAANRVGWQYRYEQFKRKYDRCIHAFMRPDALHVNEMSPWVLSQYPFSEQIYDTAGLDEYLLMADGKMLDNISAVKYSSDYDSSVFINTPWLLYQYDPFICDFYIDCTKLSIMSKYGEPELD